MNLFIRPVLSWATTDTILIESTTIVLLPIVFTNVLPQSLEFLGCPLDPFPFIPSGRRYFMDMLDHVPLTLGPSLLSIDTIVSEYSVGISIDIGRSYRVPLNLPTH